MNILSLISNPNGRINRLQFLGGYVAALVLAILLYVIPMAILLFMNSSVGVADGSADTEVVFSNLNYTYSWVALLLFIPGTIFLVYSLLCLAFKRLQDTGFSSWLLFLLLVPWINVCLLLFLILFPTRAKR
jgi:uncharacterized membrane protein YhaH (DUF805 family)